MKLDKLIETAFCHRKMPLYVINNEKDVLLRLRQHESYCKLSNVEFNSLITDFKRFKYPGSGLHDFEYDGLYFKNKNWQQLVCYDFEEFPNAIYGFTPESYCYYLSGVMNASLSEHKFVSNNIAPWVFIESIIYHLEKMLFAWESDKSYLKKFILLTTSECEAVQEWLMWLAKAENDPNTYMKAYGNLEWLIREHSSPAFVELRAITESESQSNDE